MNIQKLVQTLIIAGSTTGILSAQLVGVQFSSGFTPVATGFADASGSAAAGLVWGIIVSNGDGVFSQLPQGFALTTTTGSGTSGTQIGVSNDFYFGSSVLTRDQSSGPETGALGKINLLDNITIGTSAVTGSAFALVWFDRNITSATGVLTGETKYGLLTDPIFLIPADGDNLDAS